jgi:predicted phage terminase large subunit-like protein
MKDKRKTYGPCSEKQRLFLMDNTTDIILLGGGAGGGKSAGCLIKNLDGINDPHFRCTIFRRTAPELKRQGGLIDESQAIYRDFAPTGPNTGWKSQAMVWKFPSGATIAFSAIAGDDDLGSWQGSQLTRALIDEVCDKWTEKQVLFLLSRLRSAHSKVNPQLIMTANPDINSFMKSWVDYSLDPETGVPVAGTEHRIRWLVTIENQVYWADSPEESFELYGKPRGMVYARGMSEDEIKKHHPSKLFIPKSFRFIPTGVFDNPYLLPPKNNSYLANLLSQPYVNQLKFLHGSWVAKENGAGHFKREWVKIVEHPPVIVSQRVRSYDLASSEPTTSNKNVDYTAGVKMSRDKAGIYTIEDVVRFQKLPHGVLEEICRTADNDGIEDTVVTIPRDPGAGGKTSNMFTVKMLSEKGITVRSITTSGHSSKLHRFGPFSAMAEAGLVRVVKGDWNEAFFLELENFLPNNRNQKDDQVDATSDAFNTLCRETLLPTFALPDMSQASIIPRI